MVSCPTWSKNLGRTLVQMCRSIHVLLSLFSRIFCVRTCAFHFGFKIFVKLHLKLSCLINCTIFPRSSMNKKIKVMCTYKIVKKMSKTLKQKLSNFFWQNSCQKRQKIDNKVIKNCQLKWSDNKHVSTILVTTIWVPRASTCPARALWVEMEFYTDIEINVHF